MIDVAVTGLGVLSSRGTAPEAVAAALRRGQGAEADAGAAVAAMYAEPLPAPTAHALVDFDVKRTLGRKGTSTLDRRSGLALVACAEAIADGGLSIDDATRARTGIALGTTWGSLKAMSDYTRDTFAEQRPYLVNAMLFPNTVMNCASGQAAIRYGVQGLNATVAGGQMAFLHTLEYCANALRQRYVDVVLAGGVEEFVPHAAWATALAEPDEAGAGEAAAVFVLERATDARQARRHVDAEVLAVATAFAPGGIGGGRMPAALARCIRRALDAAGVDAAALWRAATCECRIGEGHGIEDAALQAAGAGGAERLLVKPTLGNCRAALGAMQLAGLVALHRGDPSHEGAASLLTGWTREGAVGAAVVRGWSRGGTDCQ